MELYAEITKLQLAALKDSQNTLPCRLIEGVIIRRKKGSRACWIDCDDFIKDSVIEILENHGILWQEQ